VNDEVELTLAGGAKLMAIVTHSSREALGLVAGKEAIALIKASALPIATRA
jgi:molybdate transport system regulatory protein